MTTIKKKKDTRNLSLYCEVLTENFSTFQENIYICQPTERSVILPKVILFHSNYVLGNNELNFRTAVSIEQIFMYLHNSFIEDIICVEV